MVHVASGDLLRDHRRRGTALGKLADEYIKIGNLVPDDVVIDMITHRLKAADCVHGVILDGFPRTVVQAESLDGTLGLDGKRVDKALYIKVSHDALINRLSGRWICRSCQASYHEKFNPPRVDGVCDICGGQLFQREDDKREVAEDRLKTFFELTLPVIEYYREHDSLVEIDGEQDIEKVTQDLMVALGRAPKGIAEGLARRDGPVPFVDGDGGMPLTVPIRSDGERPHLTPFALLAQAEEEPEALSA
jgi:adenylate kinase